MAGRNVLLVTDKVGGFTVSTLETALKNNDVEAKNASILDAQIESYIQEASLVLIVDCFESVSGLNNIKRLCSESEVKIALYGDVNALSEMEKIFGDENVIIDFKRPIDAEDVAKKSAEIIDKLEKDKKVKNVLVVDDNGVMLRTIKSWLEGTYDVSLANSAASAFSAIDRKMPDLILLDYEMPVCSGAQFMEMLALEEEKKDIPVIFLTSRNDAETVKEVMRLKPKGYILKTNPKEQVLKVIEDYFSQN